MRNIVLIKYCENKESRNGIKSLVRYDERKFIHMHFVLAPFVILQISQNSMFLPAFHGKLQAVGMGGT
jgi:hypothetical protein